MRTEQEIQINPQLEHLRPASIGILGTTSASLAIIREKGIIDFHAYELNGNQMPLVALCSDEYVKYTLLIARRMAVRKEQAYKDIPKIAIVTTPGENRNWWYRFELPLFYRGKPLNAENIITTIDVETTEELDLYKAFSEAVEDNYPKIEKMIRRFGEPRQPHQA